MTHLLWLPQLAIFGLLAFVYFWQRSLKKHQDKLVQPLRGQRFWRINLSRPEFYERWLHLIPFEAKGVLIDEGNQIRIRGFFVKNKQPFETVFDKQHASMKWIGRNMRQGPIYWSECSTPKGTLRFAVDTPNFQQSREAMLDLLQSVYPEKEFSKEETSDFALEKSPTSIAAIALFFGLFFYSMLDTYVFNRFELMDEQVSAIIFNPFTVLAVLVVGGALFVLAFFWLRRSRVPMQEALVLTLMVSATSLGAALPAAKRLDQWLADTPTQMVTYRLVNIDKLSPIDPLPGQPSMETPWAKDYWKRSPVGSEYPLPFLRGPLGLWQLDHKLFDPPIKEFYEKNP